MFLGVFSFGLTNCLRTDGKLLVSVYCLLLPSIFSLKSCSLPGILLSKRFHVHWCRIKWVILYSFLSCWFVCVVSLVCSSGRLLGRGWLLPVWYWTKRKKKTESNQTLCVVSIEIHFVIIPQLRRNTTYPNVKIFEVVMHFIQNHTCNKYCKIFRDFVRYPASFCSFKKIRHPLGWNDFVVTSLVYIVETGQN